MNLTIYPPKDSVFFYLFDYPIRYYGVIMATVFLVGIFVSYFLFLKKYDKKTAEVFFDYSPLVIFISVIGARIFYVFGSFEYYIKFPKEILMINHGGLSIFGAIIFGLITIFVLSKKKAFDFLAHCDVIGIFCPLCQAIGRLGNFFNQEAFGAPTNGAIKLFVDEKFRPEHLTNVEYYHPAFLYESVLDLLIFFILLFLFFKFNNLKKGTIACLYLILYSFARIIVEQIRIDSVLNIVDIPIAQIIAFVLIIFASCSLILIYKKSTK